MNLRKIFMILIFMIIRYLRIIDGFSIPDDVEIFNGNHPESSWAISNHDPIDIDNTHGTTIPFDDDSIKTIRNRRDLKYHIKSVPKADILYENDVIKAPIFDDLPHHFIKRDVERISDVDVSAQYTEQLAIDRVGPKSKRQVIEEENAMSGRTEKVWIPQPSPDDEDFFDEKTEEKKPENKTERIPVAEPLTEKQTGRGARGLSKDQWVKLPFLPPRLESDQLTAVAPNNEEINHRMPRVNFVTQGKGLQAAESRNQRESIPKASASRSSDLRTDIYPAKDNRARSLDYSSYSRRSYYYPDDYNRRPYYDDYYDDYNTNQRRYPNYDGRYDYDRYDFKNSRRYDFNDYGRSRDPYDRYDSYEDNYYRSDRYDRPRRIIYYANLPDVVRSPPNVYRYPYSRYDDDKYYGRGYNYPSSRYPYSALKKADDPRDRDLSVSSTANKEKNEAQKRQDELLRKGKADNGNRSRDTNLNSHQYPIGSSLNSDTNGKGQHQTLYHDITRMDSDLHRYEHPSFQTVIDDPYLHRRD